MANQVMTPQESGEFIVKQAKYIKVCPAGITKLTKEIVAGLERNDINVSMFSQHELHPKATDSHAVDWIFLLDTLNFCFWTPANYTRYKVNGYTGYFALCAAINRSIAQGVDLTNPHFYASIDAQSLEHLLRSDDGETKIPLLQERVDCLHQVGCCLVNRWSGKFENVVKAASGSAKKLLQLVITEFPCFRDEAEYEGRRVAFYKRAQILIGDLWACFQGDGLGYFSELDTITMFADYRIPQVLVHFGCLQYNAQLMEVLKRDEILKSGDRMEVEIRGASIYIVEKVKSAVFAECGEKLTCTDLNSIMIDHFLWDYRRRHAEDLDHIPFHKVLGVYY